MVAEDILGEKKITSPAGVCHFMAPEQHLKKPYGPGVDWWAFGIILCTMATGKSPFYSGTKLDCLVHSVTRTKPCYPEGLSTEAMKLLDEVLEKDPERRLGTRGDIRSHPFFNSIDWADLESLKAPSPWKPEGVSTRMQLSLLYISQKEPLECVETEDISKFHNRYILWFLEFWGKEELLNSSLALFYAKIPETIIYICCYETWNLLISSVSTHFCGIFINILYCLPGCFCYYWL
eukprot:XP_012825170.1 PREDICTED: protein kinase C theta type-like [Xenopus tropicalis]